MSLSVFGTDIYTEGNDGSFKAVNRYNNDLNGRTGIIRTIWDNFYLGINSANAVIGRADLVPELDENTKKKRVAEAKFLRAHYYFLLVQMFGPVHVSLEETKSVITTANRTPVPEVYNIIIKDLEEAAQNLDVNPAEYGRASKPAAEHLLARVYLTRASAVTKRAEDYQKAAEYAQKVITEYKFTLLPDFAKVFEQGAGEMNEEVIWAVQYTSDPLSNGPGNRAHLYFLMEYDKMSGMDRDAANGRPLILTRPTGVNLTTIYPENNRINDSRYDKSFKHVFYVNKPGTYNLYGKRDVKMATGDTAVWLPGKEVPKAVVDSKPYSIITPKGENGAIKYDAKLYPTLTKFLDPQRPDKTAEAGSRDFLAFRLAETYLIAAEASMMLGKTAETVKYINAVRTRAAYPGKEEAMKITEADLTLDFILDERGRELMGEQFRWFDLARTGKLVERVKKHNPDANKFIQDFHMLRPIPQDQLDRVTNKEEFQQNIGY